MIVELGLLMAGVFVAIFAALVAGIHYERWLWKRPRRRQMTMPSWANHRDWSGE